MENFVFYHAPELEAEFTDYVCKAAAGPKTGFMERFRLADELLRITENGRGALYALAFRLAEFSLERGCPVSFRGCAGNLLLTHVMGLSQNTPGELGLRWESAFGASGRQVPYLSVNVSYEIYPELMAYLTGLLPEGDLLREIPGQPENKVFLVSGKYNPAREYPSMDIYCHRLMDEAAAVRRMGDVPEKKDLFDPCFLGELWEDGLEDELILQDMLPVRDMAVNFRPESLNDCIRALGISLVPELWEQDLEAEGFKGLIATREDVYDLCRKNGIPKDISIAVMEKVGKGRLNRLSTNEIRSLREAGLWKTMASIPFLYPRCHCAEYLTHALSLAWAHRCR